MGHAPVSDPVRRDRGQVDSSSSNRHRNIAAWSAVAISSDPRNRQAAHSPLTHERLVCPPAVVPESVDGASGGERLSAGREGLEILLEGALKNWRRKIRHKNKKKGWSVWERTLKGFACETGPVALRLPLAFDTKYSRVTLIKRKKSFWEWMRYIYKRKLK